MCRPDHEQWLASLLSSMSAGLDQMATDAQLRANYPAAREVFFPRWISFRMHLITSADAACRRPQSFLRFMHHCFTHTWFQPEEDPSTLPQSRRYRHWLRHSFATYTILALYDWIGVPSSAASQPNVGQRARTCAQDGNLKVFLVCTIRRHI